MEGFIMVDGEKIIVEDVQTLYELPEYTKEPNCFPIGKSFSIVEVEMSYNTSGLCCPTKIKRVLSGTEVVERIKKGKLHDNEFIVECDDG